MNPMLTSDGEDREPRWEPGETILKREVLNDGRVWLETPVIVVSDEPDLLATFIASGTRFGLPEGPWPTADGNHPWHRPGWWYGHGLLMLQRPGDMYAVFVFWSAPGRRFDAWYLNLQEPFRRTPWGYDTQDLELDIVIAADGSWSPKDDDVLERRVADGRFTLEQVERVREEGRRLVDQVVLGERWWDDGWADWQPDPAWRTPTLVDVKDARFVR